MNSANQRFMSIQLSLAYPGKIAGNTIIFTSLGISTEYVGLFAMFNVFAKNATVLSRTVHVTQIQNKDYEIR